jgi:hypothetical protein
MNWNIVIYAVAALMVALGCGRLLVERDKKYGTREEDFSFAVFFILVGIFAIAGLFIYKYNIL